MKTTNKFLIIFLLTGCIFLFLSCNKENGYYTCTGHCADINFSGKVFIPINDSGLANIPIEIDWIKDESCQSCTSYNIASSSSDSDGRFNFTATIDTSLFTTHLLYIKTPLDSNYIITPGSFDAHYAEQPFFYLNRPGLQNIVFLFFPKVPLTIHLHRVLNDNFNSFILTHTFNGYFDHLDYIIQGQQFAKDTTIYASTSADIYTTINWEKTIGNINPSSTYSDSLICTKNGANTININY